MENSFQEVWRNGLLNLKHVYRLYGESMEKNSKEVLGNHLYGESMEVHPEVIQRNHLY